ncbi:Fibronectin type III domain protein [Verrucomicrobiia bacterium DG1235]|nr:Fibronectin type III domain protein [Verrucomicrobiae bacterium DG1235]
MGYAGAFVWAQEEEPPEEEPVIEVIKQLAFIEQHLADTGIVDGIESPYDVRVAPDGGHVYVASLKNDAVSYFVRDEVNGELDYAGFVTQADIGEDALNGARSLAMSPDGEYVYAVSMFANSLATFDRSAASGALTFVDAVYDSDGGVDGLDGARSIVISPDGKNLYVAAYDDSKLSVFTRNSSTGAASFLGVYEEGDQGVEELTEPHALAFSPDGRHLYVALWSNEIVVFSRDSSTGLLTYVSKLVYLESEPESKKESPRGLGFSPDGKFAYVVSNNNDALSVFSRDSASGELTLDGNVFNGSSGISNMDGPHAISISSDGKFIYVAASSSDAVVAFERNSETGWVTYYQSIHAETGDTWDMNGPISIGTSPDGEHVYVGSGSGTHSVVTFRREVLEDPPEFVVQPVDQSIEEGESVAFYALAQGVDLSYQWLRDGVEIAGKTLPVLTIPAVASGDDGSNFSIRVNNPGGILTSSSVTLTVLPPVVVEAPEDLTALDISSNSAELVWKDRSDNETSFEIQRRVPGGDFSALASVLENRVQYDDTSLEASTTYIYRIRAKRAENESLWSNDAVIESFDDVPQAPVNLNVVEESYNKVTLRWSDRSAVEDGVRILRRVDEFGALWSTLGTVGKNATEYVDRTVEAQSTYAYRVQAYNESGTSDYSNSVVAITSTIPVDLISPVSRPIPRDAISGYSIGVTSTEDWEAISDVDWLIVTSPTGGQGTGNQGVVYRSRLNESQDERIGKIVVGGLEHTVVQEGSPPFLRVSPSRSEADADGGTVLVSIESNVDWSADEGSDWVSITSGQSGSGYGSIVLSLEANSSFESRFAELTINSNTHTIEQSGAVPVLELDASQSRFDSVGASATVAVTSNTDWVTSVSEDWIILSGTTSGNGDGDIGFIVEANETSDIRTADILVNDIAVTITQDPPVVPDDVLEAEAVVSRFSSEGGSSSVSITGNVYWSASVSEDWISLAEVTSANGDGSVAFSVAAYEGEAIRTTDILVNDVAVTITQDPPVRSDVLDPEWVGVTVGALGAALEWSDLSDDELGFRIRRSTVGSDRVVDVADLPAGSTSYFDREAPRGRQVEYTLVSYDEIGESEEVSIVSDTLPSSNMTTVALRVEAESWTEAFLAEIPLAGDGEIVLQREGFGEEFSRLDFGGRYPVSRYDLDTDAGHGRLIGSAPSSDWWDYFSFDEVVASGAFSEVAEGIDYAASAQGAGGAYPRGARAMGQLLGAESAIIVGFEVAGEVELPVLLQGVGASLGRKRVSDVAGSLKLEVYEILDEGSASLLAVNADWQIATNSGEITVDDVIGQTGATAQLSEDGGEARLLLMLGKGRFVAVLRSETGAMGSAMLEVFDAR